jgi:hypothetical protein
LNHTQTHTTFFSPSLTFSSHSHSLICPLFYHREIRVLGSLPSHPNVCRYLFARREKDSLRLFMSLYHGTLASVIRTKMINIEKEKEKEKERKEGGSNLVLSSTSRAPPAILEPSSSLSSSSSSSSSTSSSASSASSASILSKVLNKGGVGRPTQEHYFTPKQVSFYALEVVSGKDLLPIDTFLLSNSSCLLEYTCSSLPLPLPLPLPLSIHARLPVSVSVPLRLLFVFHFHLLFQVLSFFTGMQSFTETSNVTTSSPLLIWKETSKD